ncbi:MAG: undecaprenyl-diphosphate phosphatase [Phycisphaerales bacterium]
MQSETMNVIQAAILGLVEGITEYLPISSTGHLILVSELMGLGENPDQRAAVDTFNIVIQGGAILAVLGLYFPRVMQMCKGLIGKDTQGLALALRIIIAFLPAAVLGVLLNDWIESKLFNTPAVLSALALGGVFMIAIDKWKFKKHKASDNTQIEQGKELHEITIAQALAIGFLQCIAMWPGTSRSMMTIAGGVLVGLSPKRAAEFSFLLGLPTLGGATVYSLYKTMNGDGPNMFEVIGWTPIIVGLVVATISAALAVRWLVSFLTKHGLAVFGYYRLVLTAVLGSAIAMGYVTLHRDSDGAVNPSAAEQLIDQVDGVLP